MSTAESEGLELRVVLDSNVYVSAFTPPPGLCFEIWRKALHRYYRLIVSPAIINELGGVLRDKFDWDDGRISRRLKVVTRVAEIVTTVSTIDRIMDDEDDNRILECAIAGRANLIVSGDQHLRRLKEFRGIGIVHPTDFRRMLEN